MTILEHPDKVVNVRIFRSVPYTKNRGKEAEKTENICLKIYGGRFQFFERR